MRTRVAFLATMSLLAAAAQAQCPVSAGVWSGQLGQTRVVFRMTNGGTVVDSVAVSFVDECGRAQYSADDELPTVPLQCSPWGFEWFHCRNTPSPSQQGFRVLVDFDAFAHGTAYVEFLTFGCNGGSCTLAKSIEMTPESPSEPPDPVISCQYPGGGTIEYGVSNGGTGVLYDVEPAIFGPLSIDVPPSDLIGPVDTASFQVSCTGTGRSAVSLVVRSGAVLTDVREVCFECAGDGQVPAETPCSVGGPSESIQWGQTYVGTSANPPPRVRQTADGGYALAGTAGWALRLIKTYPWGSVQWERNYTATDRWTLEDMELTEDGGFVLCGQVWRIGEPTDAFLLKVNAAGDIVWNQQYGNITFYERAHAVFPTSDGGYILAGVISFGSPAYDDLFFVKTDASGSAEWIRNHDAGDLERAWDVKQTSDGGFVLAGYTTAFGAGTYDAYLVKTNAAGIVTWEKAYGGPNLDHARSVQQTSDGGFILAGGTNSTGSYLSRDCYLVRTTANGTELWARTYGGPGLDELTVVREAPNGGYLLGGYKPAAEGGLNPHVISTTVSGATIWSKTLDGVQCSEGVDVELTQDGGAALLSSEYLGSGSSGFHLHKFGPPATTATSEEPDRTVPLALSTFPNPFNATTRLVFKGARPTRIRLTVHDVAGRLVRVLDDGTRTPSEQAWTLDASGLASGIYWATLETDRGSARLKLVVVK